VVCREEGTYIPRRQKSSRRVVEEMADTSKRQSTIAAGKAAKAPQGVSDLSRAIGAKVRITTTLASHTLEGTIFTVDPLTDLLALRSSTSPPGPPNPSSTAPGNYHIIPLSQISTFKILSAAASEHAGFEGASPAIAKVDMDALRQREDKAVAEAKKYEASRGKGVTKEAQEIFDHISRTLPTRWSGQTIIVSDSVLVESPYGVENTKAPADKGAALNQIKRVVEGYWSKKKKGGGSSTGASTPTGNGPAQPPRAPVPAVPLGQRKGG